MDGHLEEMPEQPVRPEDTSDDVDDSDEFMMLLAAIVEFVERAEPESAKDRAEMYASIAECCDAYEAEELGLVVRRGPHTCHRCGLQCCAEHDTHVTPHKGCILR